MTNSKNHAFLMCPTSHTTHLGGTPLGSGEAGGHIKKASWVHVLDALPLRLKLLCEITRFKIDQFGAGQAAANAGFVDGLATVSSGRAEFAELVGGGVGHLRLLLGWFWQLKLTGFYGEKEITQSLSLHGPEIWTFAVGDFSKRMKGQRLYTIWQSAANDVGDWLPSCAASLSDPAPEKVND